MANRRSVKNFERAYIQHSKTNRLDAGVLCPFAERMPFVDWTPPAAEIPDLRAIARRIASLTVERGRE